MKKLLVSLFLLPFLATADTVAPTKAAVDANTAAIAAHTTALTGKADIDLSNVTPGTGRESLQVGDYYAGQTRLSLPISKAWKESRGADSRPPWTAMFWGDSLTLALAEEDLFPDMVFQGYKLMSVDRASVVAGTGPKATDGTWITPEYRAIAASSTVEWLPPSGTTTGVTANRIGVLYYKGASSAETFTLEYNQNGAGWTPAATIDTSAASTAVAWYEFGLSNNDLPTRVRVTTAAAKTAKVIGCGAWLGDTENFDGRGGWVAVDLAVSGIGPTPAQTLANSTPTAITGPLAAMQVNMILGSWYDLPSCWDSGAEFDDIKTAVDAVIDVDWVMLTPGPMSTSSTSVLGTGHTADQDSRLIRAGMITWGTRNSENVVDLYPQWRDWTTAKSLGYMSDADPVHPTAEGKIAKRRLVSNAFTKELYKQKDAWFIGRGYNNTPFYASASQYGLRIGPSSQNPQATYSIYNFQGGSQNAIALGSRTAPHPGKNLTYYYTGEPASGFEYGW